MKTTHTKTKAQEIPPFHCDKDQDKMLKSPNICYIFKKTGFKDIKYDNPSGQPVKFIFVNQTRLEWSQQSFQFTLTDLPRTCVFVFTHLQKKPKLQIERSIFGP